MLSGEIVEFSVKEYWVENYVIVGCDIIVLNVMWKKCFYGQLVKCVEVQVLCKVWFEIGQQFIVEEMEGKMLEVDVCDVMLCSILEVFFLVVSEEMLQVIIDFLMFLNKDWEQDFLFLCSNIFKCDIFQVLQFIEEEVQKGFSFFQKKVQVVV